MTPDIPDIPKWLRKDGTDERLVNPIGDMVRVFRHYESDRGKIVPKQQKAQDLENDKDFVASLLDISGRLDSLDVLARIFSDNKPSKEEIEEHTLLVRQRLQLVEKFVISRYGSVEDFMEWWEK